MSSAGSSMNTSIRVVVNPTAVGLGSRFLPGTASWTKNGAPPRSSPATPPRSHNRPAPSTVVYHVTAASASDTINITERAGRAAALLIVLEDGTGHRPREFERGVPRCQRHPGAEPAAPAAGYRESH